MNGSASRKITLGLLSLGISILFAILTAGALEKNLAA